jgi:conjugative transfer region protein (TIGR03748 family)
MPPLLSCLLVLSCFSLPMMTLAQSSVQTGRYTAVATGPTEAQREPLKAVVTVELSAEVTTIREAVQKVLADTGYALVDGVSHETEVFGLLERPLPAVQRVLGPITVLDALKTLAGPASRVVVDPVHRLVAIEIDPTARPPRHDREAETR